MSAVILFPACGRLESPRTAVRLLRKRAVCPSGVLVIEFDGDSLHFCILRQSIFTSATTEKRGQFTLAVRGSGKALLMPEPSAAQFECRGLCDRVQCGARP